jgi:hypothetical protein
VAVAHRIRNNGILTPRLLTLEQAATYPGLTKEALKAKVHMGRIPTVSTHRAEQTERMACLGSGRFWDRDQSACERLIAV